MQKSSNRTVCIPFARSHFLQPREWKQFKLPWKIEARGPIFTACAVNIAGTLASYAIGKSGCVTLNVFNARDVVTVISSRSAVIRFFNVDRCEVKKLPPVQVSTTEGNLCDDEKRLTSMLLQDFPTVFDLAQHPITAPMKKLQVSLAEVPCNAPKSLDRGRRTSLRTDQVIKTTAVESLLEEYIVKGYITECSPAERIYLSPLNPVSKPNGEVRITNDFRALNAYFPNDGMRQVDTRRALNSIPSSWRIYSIIDLKDGFFSIPLSLDMRPFFGFSFGTRHFFYNRLPQGFNWSPTLFAERIAYVLRGIPHVQYADDLLVGGDDVEEHNRNLRMIFGRLARYGLKVNKDKLRLLRKSIQYLRHEICEGTRTLAPYLSEKHTQLGPINNRKSLERAIGILSCRESL